MIAKVNHSLKEAMLEGIDHLTGRSNVQGESFYINVQQPEARLESRHNAKALLRRYQTKYSSAKVEIRGDKVYVNNDWKRPLIHAPTPEDIYFDSDEQKELNKIKLVYTQPEDSRSSTFWAAAVRVDSVQQVQRAYNKVRQDAPSVDHIAAAFVTQHEDEMTSGLADDKEYGAGHKILRSIRDAQEEHIAVFVAHRFGGEHLGPNRFELISKLATRAIVQLNKFVPARSPTTIPKQLQDPASVLNSSDPSNSGAQSATTP